MGRPGTNLAETNVWYTRAMKTAPPLKRGSVVQAAVRLFARKGYHATSMQDIAEALGIQRGSIYHHIDSKDDLLFEIMEASVLRLIEPIEEIIALPLPAGDKLRRFIETHLDMIISMRAELSIFLHELKSLPPARRQKIVVHRDYYEDLLQRILREGLASGDFREVDMKFAGFTVLSVCNWFCQWYSPQGPLNRVQIAAVFTDLLLRGLMTSPAQHRGNVGHMAGTQRVKP